MCQNKKCLLVFSLCFLFLMICFHSAYTKGPTYVSGHLSKKNMVWNPGHSPYIITGNTYVEDGCTLRILPGVEVRFNLDARMCVFGELIVNGNENQKILFTSNSDNPSAGDWRYVKFIEAKGNIDNAIFENAYYGVYADQSDIEIRNCQFLDISRSAVVLYKSSSYFEGNFISGINNEGEHSHSYGIEIENNDFSSMKELVVTNSIFKDNLETFGNINPNTLQFEAISIKGNVKGLIENSEFLERDALEKNLHIGISCDGFQDESDNWLTPVIEIFNNIIEGRIHTGIDFIDVYRDDPALIYNNKIYLNETELGKSYMGIHLENSRARIMYNDIINTLSVGDRHRSAGITINERNDELPHASNVTIEHNFIKECFFGLHIILRENGYTKIESNDIIGNIDVGTSGMTVDWKFVNDYPDVIIQKNNFINHQNNLWVRYPDCAHITEKVNAINNWWGTDRYDEIVNKFFCFFCSNFSGIWETILDFHPYASKPFEIR